MKKSKWNFTIDLIMFLVMALIAGLGLLIKYVLLPGSERWIKYGQNVELSWLGLDRHQWGLVHLLLGALLFGLLIVHIVLHWKTIICWFKKYCMSKFSSLFWGLSFLLICLLFLVFPFLIHVDVEEIESGRERFSHKTDTVFVIDTSRHQAVVKEGHQHNQHSDLEVKGFMTLSEVSIKYNVPMAELKKDLKLPNSVSGTQKLGHLRKQYGFKMSEVEKIIVAFRKQDKK
jgi:Domain of unknown function (DUF4405)